MESINLAKNKANQEIKESIKKIKELCKDFNYGELAYCIYYIHAIRILKSPEVNNIQNMTMDRFNDVLYYSVSCIFKYSRISKIQKSNYPINLDKSILMTEIANHIHSLYEMYNYLTILDEVTLEGERNQHLKIDLNHIKNNPDKFKSFEYKTRFEKEITAKKSTPLPHSDLLKKFAIKYTQYDSIAYDVFGLNIDEITTKLNTLLNILRENLESNAMSMPLLENGNIDAQNIETVRLTVKSFIIEEKTILEIFGKNGMKFIDHFTFQTPDFKPHELNFHYILRKPILKIKNEYIIVPELLLDSLFINFHYTIIENTNYVNKHKQIMSDIFVDEIMRIGQNHGFSHFKSNLELYKGKNNLGDIDLVLRANGYDILIEAKNHTVPLPVYFGDHEEITIRLKYLQESWEKKVDNRYKHLLENHDKYGIQKDFKYLIISKYPEILSHHSNFLVLSINEFDFYLKNNASYNNFYDLFHNLYQQEEEWDKKEAEIFMKETLGWSLSKE